MLIPTEGPAEQHLHTASLARLSHPVHIVIVVHDHKAEAPRLAGARIPHNACVPHLAILAKLTLQVL